MLHPRHATLSALSCFILVDKLQLDAGAAQGFAQHQGACCSCAWTCALSLLAWDDRFDLVHATSGLDRKVISWCIESQRTDTNNVKCCPTMQTSYRNATRDLKQCLKYTNIDMHSYKYIKIKTL